MKTKTLGGADPDGGGLAVGETVRLTFDISGMGEWLANHAARPEYIEVESVSRGNEREFFGLHPDRSQPFHLGGEDNDPNMPGFAQSGGGHNFGLADLDGERESLERLGCAWAVLLIERAAVLDDVDIAVNAILRRCGAASEPTEPSPGLTPGIWSRDEFRRKLEAASSELQDLADSPVVRDREHLVRIFPFIPALEDQFANMKRWTAKGRTPRADERNEIDVGARALRDFPDVEPLAGLCLDLDRYFKVGWLRWWLRLGSSRAEDATQGEPAAGL